jgi:hypothetical protein
MSIKLLAAGVAAAAFLPCAAFADSPCEREHSNQAVATVGGAVAGAVIGSQVAGHGAKSEGGIIGGIAGAVIGNQVAKPKDCNHAYGFYDHDGKWHASGVARAEAAGYYDRDGRWVDGEPRGYYDDRGAWREGQGNYDRDGRWVPQGSAGYYDPSDHWVALSVSTGPLPPPPPRAYDAPPPPPPPRADEWWSGASIHEREDHIHDRIVRAQDHGELGRKDTRRFLDRLSEISDRERHMPHPRGYLRPDDERYIQTQLDDLSADLRSRIR